VKEEVYRVAERYGVPVFVVSNKLDARRGWRGSIPCLAQRLLRGAKGNARTTDMGAKPM
jgi:hypothetical protein